LETRVGYWSYWTYVVQRSTYGPGSKGPISGFKKNEKRNWRNCRPLSSVMPLPVLPGCSWDAGTSATGGLALATQVGKSSAPESTKYPTLFQPVADTRLTVPSAFVE